MSSGPRFRFAPSPTGFFHVGGARTALYNWALAKRLGGTFVLRIEDTDEARNRPEWTQGIIDALAWIGIDDDDPPFEGPVLPEPVRRGTPRGRQQPVRGGPRVLLRPHRREQIQERTKAEGTRATTASRATAASVPARPGVALSCPGGQPPRCTTWCAARWCSTTRTIEDFVLLRGNGTPDVLAGQCGRRHRDAHLPRRARRGASAQHAQAADAVAGARPSAAGVGARAAAGQRAAQEAVEAARQGGARAVPRRGVPARPRWSTT